MVTVAVLDVVLASLAENVKLSAPTKPALGTYSKSCMPVPLRVSVPDAGSASTA